jgi:ADP-heptose:LPS heptosyltransferase
VKALYSVGVFIEAAFNMFLLFVAQVRARAPKQHSHKGRRILVTRLDSLGDFVLFTASLPSYRELFVGDHITLLLRKDVALVARNCPYVDEIWTLDVHRFRWNPIERLRWMMRLAGGGFDHAINSVYSTDFEFLACFVGWTNAPRRIAHQCIDRGRQRNSAWPWYTELVAAEVEWKFEIERNDDMVHYLGFRGGHYYYPKLWSGQTISETNWAIPVREIKQWAIVFPGAQASFRRWDADCFAECIRTVHAVHPRHWVICGSKDESLISNALTSKLQAFDLCATNLCGQTSLDEVVSLLREADFCLGNESGPLHMAAAVGTIAFGIVGGGHFGRFFPYPGSPLTVGIWHPMDCFRCYWACVYPQVECLKRVDPHIAASKIIDTLSARAYSDIGGNKG